MSGSMAKATTAAGATFSQMTISEQQQSISKHPEFYFSDGSVVLIVGETALRIHQSLLARHSEVFNGMWDVPQPSSIDNYDGCAMVKLEGDEVADWVDVCSVLYDPFHFDKIKPETTLTALITFISGILRISTKYSMVQLRNKCISILQNDFPSTLAGCDDVLKRAIRYNPSEIVRVIPLARETNVPRVLPWAFYLCAQIGVDDLISDPVLSWKDKALCLAGKERLWIIQKTQTHTFLLNFQRSYQCTSACKNRETITVEEVEGYRAAPHVLEEFKEWGSSRLCAKCVSYYQGLHKEGRERAWENLPEIFSLGTWEEIFEEQSCDGGDGKRE